MTLYHWIAILGCFLTLCFIFTFVKTYLRMKTHNGTILQKLAHYEHYANQLTSSLDSLSDPIWIKDENQAYLYCNDVI